MKNTAHRMMLSLLGTLLSSLSAFAGTDSFIIVVQTDNPGTSANNQFTIPTYDGSTYKYKVDCDSDGAYETVLFEDGNYTCSYPTDNNATARMITIDGLFPRIYFNNQGDKEKFLYVEQWGAQQWESMEDAFHGASNLVYVGTVAPDLSLVTSMKGMFMGAASFNQDISNWDVSNVTDMGGLFYEANLFNQSLGDWNVSNVTNMNSMFNNAINFNQNIGSWDVSKVTNMGYMFSGANSFNQDIGDWNTSSVRYMHNMFSAFNDYIIIDTIFNQDIGDWDVSNVTDMSDMFFHASSFYQDIGDWNVSKVSDMDAMLNTTRLSVSDYDTLLISWDKLSLQSNVPFDAGDARYCNGADAKIHMQTTDLWTITDNGEFCNFYIDSPNTMYVKSAQTEVGTVSVFGNDGSEIVYTIIGGADRDKFSIDSATGVLRFITPPNAAYPGDRNADNVYRVRIKAQHPAISDAQTIRVTVTYDGNAALVPVINYLLF